MGKYHFPQFLTIFSEIQLHHLQKVMEDILYHFLYFLPLLAFSSVGENAYVELRIDRSPPHRMGSVMRENAGVEPNTQCISSPIDVQLDESWDDRSGAPIKWTSTNSNSIALSSRMKCYL